MLHPVPPWWSGMSIYRKMKSRKCKHGRADECKELRKNRSRDRARPRTQSAGQKRRTSPTHGSGDDGDLVKHLRKPAPTVSSRQRGTPAVWRDIPERKKRECVPDPREREIFVRTVPGPRADSQRAEYPSGSTQPTSFKGYAMIPVTPSWSPAWPTSPAYSPSPPRPLPGSDSARSSNASTTRVPWRTA